MPVFSPPPLLNGSFVKSAKVHERASTYCPFRRLYLYKAALIRFDDIADTNFRFRSFLRILTESVAINSHADLHDLHDSPD